MRQVILIAAIALASWAGKLHGAELFRAIDESEWAAITEAEDDFIAMSTWTAKRYRIVQVDNTVLEQGGEFTINWFDDAQRPAKTRTWKGEIEIVDPSAIDGQQLERYEMLDDIILVSESWDVDEEAGKATPVRRRKAATRSSPPTKRIFPNAIRTVEGSVRSPIDRTHYIVRRLKDNPRYHIVIELDPSKNLSRPENYRKYQAFLEARGIQLYKPKREQAEEARAALFAQGTKSLDPAKSGSLYKLLQTNGIDPTDLSLPQRPSEE